MERSLSPVFSLAGGTISWPLDLTTTLGAFGELERPESSKLEAPRRVRGLTDLSPKKPHVIKAYNLEESPGDCGDSVSFNS